MGRQKKNPVHDHRFRLKPATWVLMEKLDLGAFLESQRVECFCRESSGALGLA